MVDRDPQDGFREALNEVLRRIEHEVKRSAKPQGSPIRMYIAGGAALHLLTGARVTADVDATFSRRVLLGDDIEVAYRDADGRARLVYLDRSYNDSLGLMHEDAYDDSRALSIAGVDKRVIDVRVLAPLDLAVSKLARFSDQDRLDLESLAREGLIDSASLRRRADEALQGYVGNITRVQNSIDIACRVIDAIQPRKAAKAKRKRK